MAEKIYLATTGNICELMVHFGTRITNYLNSNGLEVVENPELSDSIIIIGCAVGKEAEEQSVSIAKKYVEKYAGKKRIIISGCFAKINEALQNFEGVSCVGPVETSEFDELFNAKIPLSYFKGNRLNKEISEAEKCEFSDYYHIEIGTGCNNRCSYCAIKKAKGDAKSKPVPEIIKEFKQGLSLGFKNFVLLADDCGSYGSDINTDFAVLLNELNSATEDEFKINIHYFEPRMLLKLYPKINKEVFERRVSAINIPLQSISNRILKLMNRNYNSHEVLKVAKDIRLRNPNIFMRTHMIYGFPTETSDEFMDYFRLKEYFDSIQFYKYSDRPGTKAASIFPKVDEKEKEQRRKLVGELYEY